MNVLGFEAIKLLEEVKEHNPFCEEVATWSINLAGFIHKRVNEIAQERREFAIFRGSLSPDRELKAQEEVLKAHQEEKKYCEILRNFVRTAEGILVGEVSVYPALADAKKDAWDWYRTDDRSYYRKIDALKEIMEPVREAYEDPKVPMPPYYTSKVRITYEDKENLVLALARWSESGAPTGSQFFENLVKQANFSEKIMMRGLGGYTGDPISNARKLVNFAVGVGTNRADGNAALGSIIYPLIPAAGLEDAIFLVSMCVKYRLLRSELLDDLKAQFQIPEVPTGMPLPVDTAAVIGPPVKWDSETEQLELQGWFAPEPQWLDIALLMKAADRARSVCRVEVGVVDKGTGVLIGRDLVLTSYHVMGQSLEAKPEIVSANAQNTVLRFGAFTAEGPAAAGQEVRLHKEQPIAASSTLYDFALLRTDDAISAAADVKPCADLGITPVKMNSLYVLQHPDGGPMKVALNNNGVTWVDSGLVTIRYTTKAAGGSSGSPCFDADWKLVALHHAGKGSKGEGILIKFIFQQIQRYLKA